MADSNVPKTQHRQRSAWRGWRVEVSRTGIYLYAIVLGGASLMGKKAFDDWRPVAWALACLALPSLLIGLPRYRLLGALGLAGAIGISIFAN